MNALLIGGFDAFPPYRENPSWVIAQALRDAIAQQAIGATALCLPVEFGATQATLQRALEQETPRAVLLLGLSGQTPFLDVEQVALNVGERPAGERGATAPFPLAEAATEARRNPIDWAGPVQALRAEGLPVRVSFHAGTFLCNAAYYAALGWAEQDAARRAVFVHMPLLPDQAARHFQATRGALASLAPETILRALLRIAHRLLAE